MNRNNEAQQACALCKHQRKKCDEDCDMAPYFPVSRFQEFQQAQRLFGLSNIVKLMNDVEPHQKKHTAESILMEARLRAEDPRGCLGIVKDLKSKIRSYEAELNAVNQQLALVRDTSVKKKILFDPKRFPHGIVIKADGDGDKKEKNYGKFLEEALAKESFDINCLIPLMESNNHIDSETLERIKKQLNKCSEKVKIDDKGKRPMECDDEEEDDDE